MSRLSEILGVPEGREFKFKGAAYRITGNRRYYFSSKGEWKAGVDEDELVDMLDNPELIELIPEKPKLTEQQITAIKGRIVEGTPWAARSDNSSNIYFYGKKPYFSGDGVYCESLYSAAGFGNFYDFITFENSPVYLPELIEDIDNE